MLCAVARLAGEVNVVVAKFELNNWKYSGTVLVSAPEVPVTVIEYSPGLALPVPLMVTDTVPFAAIVEGVKFTIENAGCPVMLKVVVPEKPLRAV